MTAIPANRTKLRACLVCLALILPGSFLFLPLIWLWQRSRVR